MSHDPVLNLIGLANKAGKLEIGEEPVGALCRARQAKLILMAADAAPNTCRRAAHFGQAGNVLFLQLPFTKEELGWQLGRTSCAMMALADPGFSASIVEKLAARDPDRYGPAAQQLRQKADRALQRQREKRQHEKNLREGKRKPWAAPPKLQEDAQSPKGKRESAQRAAAPSKGRRDRGAKSLSSPARPNRSQPKKPLSGPSAHKRPDGGSRPSKPGPGGRRLSGKLRHDS